jgi:predicted DNA-binding WGR domain protein
MARYEFVEGTSNKFWEITRDGLSVTTRYGRIGSAGQSTTKTFPSEAAATREHDKLVAEKLGKGYVAVGETDNAAAPVEHAKAGTAFRLADLEQLDDRPYELSSTFMGLTIADYDPEEGLKDPARRAYRLRVEPGEGNFDELRELLKSLAADPNASKLKALVVANWDENVAMAGVDGPERERPAQLIAAVAAAGPHLSGLAALFVGDIHAEEAEISWQALADISPLLAAFPQLEHLRVRGNPVSKTGMGTLKSATLRSLQLEGSNLDREVVQQVASADLPALEHLEIWLGPSEYAAPKTAEDIAPILSGTLFPSLRYLGLRDTDDADQVAAQVAASKVIEQLEVLDLSLGTLGDVGAEALLASPAVARLKMLDIRHHYISAPVLSRLKALKPVKVREEAADEDDDGEGGRYVAVAE